MSRIKIKTFLPIYPVSSSDDDAKRSPVLVTEKGRTHIHMPQNSRTSSTASPISPTPVEKNMKASYGQLLAPAPGRLTPPGQGRIKAPPVCMAPALKRIASGIDDLSTDGVCFSSKEADSCAEKSLVLCGRDYLCENGDEMPLAIEKCDPSFSWDKANIKSVPLAAQHCLSEGKAFVSSNATVITTSSGSSSVRSAFGSEIAVVASTVVPKGPPLEVVRTDLVDGSGDELPMAATPVPQVRKPVAEAGQELKDDHLSVATAPEAPSSVLSTAFTDNLIKGNISRQGRSLQRWLIHSPTGDLVRQVAGTVPITRDGRIILVSASRKTEWILPKGGWDTDETKEECAVRETFEEGGLLGRLGGCLDPIDYERKKAKKRRLDGGNRGNAEEKLMVGGDKIDLKQSADIEGRKREGCMLLRQLPSKCAKMTENGTSRPNEEVLSLPVEPGSADSVSIDPKNYAFVRMLLFPLYVTTVKSDWPEKGRLRKLVDIDEAISIMESQKRPYFKRGLEMIKERGLHQLKP